MTPTKIHLTFRQDASGSVLIDKASPEPFVGSEEFVRAQGWEKASGMLPPPEDGSEFLAGFQTICGRLDCTVARWSDDLGIWLSADDIALPMPTHWMPLPDAPSEKGVG